MPRRFCLKADMATDLMNLGIAPSSAHYSRQLTAVKIARQLKPKSRHEPDADAGVMGTGDRSKTPSQPRVHWRVIPPKFLPALRTTFDHITNPTF